VLRREVFDRIALGGATMAMEVGRLDAAGGTSTAAGRDRYTLTGTGCGIADGALVAT
jgi:hypothetical protein